jgi:mRNA-degrading endonuclease RelE of RelBE toxin-antitoxin system
MAYEVKTIDVFERQAKRLTKKYASLRKELLGLVEELKENPGQGTAIGKGCYKIRISIASKGKGKSGGARVITNLVVGRCHCLPAIHLRQVRKGGPCRQGTGRAIEVYPCVRQNPEALLPKRRGSSIKQKARPLCLPHIPKRDAAEN